MRQLTVALALALASACIFVASCSRDNQNAAPTTTSSTRAAVDHLFGEGHLLAWGIPATRVLVETLLDRASDGDVAEAEAAIERFATAPADEGLVIRDIWLLRLRALLGTT